MNVLKSLYVTLAGVALAATPMIADAQPTVDVQMTSTIFLNGGIGVDEADAMRSRAAEFPLRVIFAEGPRNEFTANVPLAIVDERGNAVLVVPDAGPLLYVMLPTGTYTVSAESDGIRKTQQVTLSQGRGRDVVFHWSVDTAPALDAM
jgi:hypothetical protein